MSKHQILQQAAVLDLLDCLQLFLSFLNCAT